MSTFCGARRLPRAAIDPIDSASAALAVVKLALHRPLTHETIVLVLAPDRRGQTIVVVDGTADPDSMVGIVEHFAEAGALAGGGGCLVVATVRPAGGPLPGDDERWLEASDIAERAGVELLEWFVVGGDHSSPEVSAWCPRDLLGEAPRWDWL